jgi:hypothetical protein
MAKIKIPTGRNGQYAVIDTAQIESVSRSKVQETLVRTKSGVTHRIPFEAEAVQKALNFTQDSDLLEMLKEKPSKKK